MCRIVYQSNGLVFYKPVYCSTDPVELEGMARYYADMWEVRILAIEPCVLQFFPSAVPSSSEEADQEPQQTAQALHLVDR